MTVIVVLPLGGEAAAVIVKVAVVLPAGIVTVSASGVATARFPLTIVITSPFGGAGTSSVTVPVTFAPGAAEAGSPDSVTKFWTASFATSTSFPPLLAVLERPDPAG